MRTQVLEILIEDERILDLEEGRPSFYHDQIDFDPVDSKTRGSGSRSRRGSSAEFKVEEMRVEEERREEEREGARIEMYGK